MTRSLRFALHLTLVVAVVAALQIVAGTPPGGGSPYLSSLSTLGPSTALAAPGCNSKYCAKEPGRKSPTCHQAPVNYNCSASGNVCTITAC
ncbi:MAG TPA: hypothetical protein VEW47_00685 [Candidatus Dormibacteraeota bacterium]|nr:hypothetical protein [Candidatus Dormibacteraeota bacterium]